MIWVGLMGAIVLVLALSWLRDTNYGVPHEQSHLRAYDAGVFPGHEPRASAVQRSQDVSMLSELSAEVSDILHSIQMEHDTAHDGDVHQQRQRQHQVAPFQPAVQERNVIDSSGTLENAQVPGNPGLRKAGAPAASLGTNYAVHRFSAKSPISARESWTSGQPSARGSPLESAHDSTVSQGYLPFSGLDNTQLQAEARRLASAVDEYRAGDFKKYKAMMSNYRHLLHKYNMAHELRRRPYPPLPKFPTIKLQPMPPTHTLEAKCYAAASNKGRERLTIMNKEVYKVGSEIVTWVRTVGEVTQDFWSVLPQTDPFKRAHYRTCAVVASAGIMRNRLFGKQIDAHDAVIRFNSAFTRGMEAYVGSKTTIRLMNRENFGFTESEDEMVLQHITTEQMMTDFANFRRLFPRVKLYPIHPAFYDRVVTEEVEHPSNGYFGIRLALELCDCVRMYGFIRTWEGYMTYHYHDDYTPRQSQHSRDSTELPLIRGLLNEFLGRLVFSHPCILQDTVCEGCPPEAARCEKDVPYPVPEPGYCYGHGPPGGIPHLGAWTPGKFWPEQMPDEGGRLARARDVYKPAHSNMNAQKPFLPFADERRSCFRRCQAGESCRGGASGICSAQTAQREQCIPWRDVSPQLQKKL